MNVDVDVLRLAARFVVDAQNDLDGPPPGHIVELAQEIQDCVESYFLDHKKVGL